MNVKDLENKWETIGKSSSITYLRINSTCIPNLNLGKNGDNRILVLNIPHNYKTQFRGYKKENIEVFIDKDSNSIILELLDPFYNAVFNDLVLSLYNQIKDIQDSTESTRTFISTINRWADLLSNSFQSGLSKEQVKGLFGELVVLKSLIGSSSCKDINTCLSSWVGPYDETTDFVFDNLNIEVKTKISEKSKVRISSEFQLDEEDGKSLELVVVSVDEIGDNLKPISLIIDEVRKIIIDKGGDVIIFLESLSQLSLTFSNVNNYDHFLFELKAIITYDCDKVIEGNEFPKIVKSNLPKELSNIKYDINLSKLDGYIKE